MSVTVAATFCATLVDEWVAAGVRHGVVAPGSRSTPLALALSARPELAVHVVIDERSAGFVALGLGLATGTPAVLLCTSGTAAVHFHAAVVEADLSAVAMIVCTADRPPELRDVGAPQTIDQTRLYGPAVRWFCDPGVAEESTAASWRTLARRAVVHSRGPRPGPVHLNLPFREPLVGVAGPLPARRWPEVVDAAPAPAPTSPARRMDLSGAPAAWGSSRGLIVAGHAPGLDPEVVRALSAARRWPVLADPRSALRGPAAVGAFDAIVREPGFAAGHVPDVVVRVGQPPASKALAQWLAASGAQQLQLGGPTRWIDPDHSAAVVDTDPAPWCSALAGLGAGDTGFSETGWRDAWDQAEAVARRVFDAALDGPLCEPTVARIVSGSLEPGHTLVAASSMPIRDLEWFGAARSDVVVLANRGANGIDGVTSTALGAAMAGRRVTLLIGDVAFLHDQGALTALASRPVDLTVVVVDNDGGGIFEFLPQAEVVERTRFEHLFATPHGTDLVALARAHGLRADTVHDPAGLREALNHPGRRVVRVATERRSNVTVHRELVERVHAAMREVAARP